MAQGQYKPGLEGVPATQSNISFIDGQLSTLEYRGISIEQLTEHSTFLETAFLLIFGHLPTQQELTQFMEDVKSYRPVKYRIRDMIKSFPETCHPMDALLTCVAGLGLFYPRPEGDSDQYVYDTVVRLLGKLPSMVAAFNKMRHGDDPIPSRDDLSHEANFLYILSGKVPEEAWVRIFDQCLILHAEHTVNASTFSLLVSASTLSTPYSAMAAAVGALSGELHGGASEQVMKMLRDIGTVENVRPYIEDRLDKKLRIMGIGHRIYKVKDPRAVILQQLAGQLFNPLGYDKYYEVALEVERVSDELLGPKGLYPNVDFYSGLIYSKLGIPDNLFTPVFAIARTAGWLAHWREQRSNNRIFRPTQEYTGEHNQPYIPMEQRSGIPVQPKP